MNEIAAELREALLTRYPTKAEWNRSHELIEEIERRATNAEQTDRAGIKDNFNRDVRS